MTISATRPGGLWRHRGFIRLWGAQTISSFGARIAREGLPMTAVITLKAGPEALGLFAALTLGAQAALGVVAGALADRLPRRRLLIAADLIRAAVLAAVPLAALSGRLTLAEIYLAGVLMGAANVVFDVADHAFLPTLIDRAELADGNGKLAATDAAAEIGGPAIAGLLFQVVAPPLAVAVNALTYLGSAALLTGVGKDRTGAATTPEDDASEALDLTSGLRLVLAHPLVRPLWQLDATRSFFGNFFAALYILLAIDVLKLTPGMLGLTVAMGGVGGLAGASAAAWIGRRLGAGPTILVTGLAGGAMAFLIPLAAGPPLAAMAFLAAAQLFGDGLQTISAVVAATLRQSVLPAEKLGRAAGAFATGAAAAGVLGALAGGTLGAAYGPRVALLVAASGLTAASLFVLFSPLRRLKTY